MFIRVNTREVVNTGYIEAVITDCSGDPIRICFSSGASVDVEPEYRDKLKSALGGKEWE